jgi:(R,R)-butanediol dehydrogenase / meso-butanediol dehydrogenase / diacetyl reductase
MTRRGGDLRALRWHAAGDLRLDDVAEPVATPGTAVIEVAFCGLCGTDLHEYAHGPSMIRTGPHPLTGQAPPVTLGHELSGRVIAMDGSAPGLAVGSRVAVDPCLRCGQCRWCRTGEYHICAKGGSLGLASDGGFAAYVRAPLECLHAIPDEVSDEFAAMAEPLAVGLHAAKRAQIGPGDAVLVLGAGPIGLAAVMGAKAAGAAAIFVSEPAAARGEAALRAGATEVFDPTRSDVRAEVFVRTGRVGPDVVIDGTGRREAIRLGVRALRRGGRMAVAGIGDADMTLDLRELVLYERTLLGSLGYNFDIPRVVALMATGRLDPTPLLTDVRPLSEGAATFAELSSPGNRQIKILLSPKER